MADTNKNINKNRLNVDRTKQIRRDNDSIQDLYLGLYDIDEAIKYYFDNVAKLQINDSSGLLTDVPVIYASPENWKSLQKSELKRDSRGKVQLPIMAYKRDTITKDRSLGNKIDSNKPLYHSFTTGYNKNNRYDRFSIVNNKLETRKPVEVIKKIVIPDYVTVTYSCIVYTEFLTQMNTLIENISYSEGTYWGDKNRFLVRTKIDDFPSTIELNIGEDRAVKSEFNITINGHIIPKNIQKQASMGSAKEFTKSVLTLGETIVTDINKI